MISIGMTMKLCFDTSVVIDIIGKTKFFFDAYAAYDVAMWKRFVPYLSVSSTTDIAYVLHSRGLISKTEAVNSLATVFEFFDLIDTTPEDCKLAQRSKMPDYEDALIAYAALRHGSDFIITRDKKGFIKSPVPALSPKEFVGIYKPDYFDYEMVDI